MKIIITNNEVKNILTEMFPAIEELVTLCNPEAGLGYEELNDLYSENIGKRIERKEFTLSINEKGDFELEIKEEAMIDMLVIFKNFFNRFKPVIGLIKTAVETFKLIGKDYVTELESFQKKWEDETECIVLMNIGTIELFSDDSYAIFERVKGSDKDWKDCDIVETCFTRSDNSIISDLSLKDANNIFKAHMKKVAENTLTGELGANWKRFESRDSAREYTEKAKSISEILKEKKS